MKESINYTEGDLEVAILSESLEAFYGIINHDLYKVYGNPPNQNIMFHNSSCFDLFLIRLQEVFAESSWPVTVINGKRKNLSLLSATIWFTERYPEESEVARLTLGANTLHNWLNEVRPFEFWDGKQNITFQLTRKDVISIGANLSKHNLLRLSSVLEKIYDRCKNDAGMVDLKKSDVIHIIDPFLQELQSRLLYHSTYLVEILFDYFAAINRVVIKRKIEYTVVKTEKCKLNVGDIITMADLKYPEGLTSWDFEDLYSSTLIFRSFDEERFRCLRPVTSKSLKLRY